jgi:hypothetical protein
MLRLSCVPMASCLGPLKLCGFLGIAEDRLVGAQIAPTTPSQKNGGRERIRGAEATCIKLALDVGLQTPAVLLSAATDLVALATSDQPLLGCSRAPAMCTSLSSEPNQLTEAMRRSLKELSMLSRCERRAIGRPDRVALFIIAQNALLNASKNLQVRASIRNVPLAEQPLHDGL